MRPFKKKKQWYLSDKEEDEEVKSDMLLIYFPVIKKKKKKISEEVCWGREKLEDTCRKSWMLFHIEHFKFLLYSSCKNGLLFI